MAMGTEEQPTTPEKLVGQQIIYDIVSRGLKERLPNALHTVELPNGGIVAYTSPTVESPNIVALTPEGIVVINSNRHDGYTQLTGFLNQPDGEKSLLRAPDIIKSLRDQGSNTGSYNLHTATQSIEVIADTFKWEEPYSTHIIQNLERINSQALSTSQTPPSPQS